MHYNRGVIATTLPLGPELLGTLPAPDPDHCWSS
jgi:hypothetical protein